MQINVHKEFNKKCYTSVSFCMMQDLNFMLHDKYI